MPPNTDRPMNKMRPCRAVGGVVPREMPLLPVLLMLLAGFAATPLAAQSASGGVESDPSIDYRREVFRYQAAGRPDPFRPLVGSADLGVRIEDLMLRGVIFDPDPARSLAVIGRVGEDRPVRASLGDRIGGVRVVAIRPGSIDVVVEEFGIVRRETLTLSRGPASEVSND
jgi:hypothetical protein